MGGFGTTSGYFFRIICLLWSNAKILCSKRVMSNLSIAAATSRVPNKLREEKIHNAATSDQLNSARPEIGKFG
jgi:hypothetical protein